MVWNPRVIWLRVTLTDGHAFVPQLFLQHDFECDRARFRTRAFRCQKKKFRKDVFVFTGLLWHSLTSLLCKLALLQQKGKGLWEKIVREESRRDPIPFCLLSASPPPVKPISFPQRCSPQTGPFFFIFLELLLRCITRCTGACAHSSLTPAVLRDACGGRREVCSASAPTPAFGWVTVWCSEHGNTGRGRRCRPACTPPWELKDPAPPRYPPPWLWISPTSFHNYIVAGSLLQTTNSALKLPSHGKPGVKVPYHLLLSPLITLKQRSQWCSFNIGSPRRENEP